jgi:hypothetical protein
MTLRIDSSTTTQENIMNIKQWTPLIMAATLGLAMACQAATVSPGSGGYTASIAFKKKDLRTGEVTQNFSTTPISWCNPTVNPNNPNPANTSFDGCYGSAGDAKWFLLDFTKLPKQEVGKIKVTITASSHSSTGLVPPAITVFQGYQDGGTWGTWFPNQFQGSPSFWASKLMPFTGGTTNSSGWATAYSASSSTGGIDSISVEGDLKLKKGRKNAQYNYLTVIVGGDTHKLGENQAVDFTLGVKIAKPVKPGGGGGFDACGCPAGTLWHHEMNHCMAIGLCDLEEYKGQCQTGDQCIACSKNGVPQRPKPGGVCP